MLELFLLGVLSGMAAHKGKQLVETAKSRAYRAAIAKPENAEYVKYITEVGKSTGLPDGLLLRLAFQESAFNPNAKSPKGASGMFQIMPGVHKEAASFVFDWKKSAVYAAGFLKRLYGRFGKWEYALKAYNCGEGNLNSLLRGKGGVQCRSRETTGYWVDISADVPGLM